MTDTEIVEKLCRLFKCGRDQVFGAAAQAQIMDSLFCDQPEDRLYHAKDRTWWRRNEEGNLVAADPPPGWAAIED